MSDRDLLRDPPGVSCIDPLVIITIGDVAAGPTARQHHGRPYGSAMS